MRLEELKLALSAELGRVIDEHGRIAILDEFHISGYMCSVKRIEDFLFPLLDRVYENVDDIQDRQIEDCELTVRTKNCLRSCGIRTVRDLTRKTVGEITRTRNMGKKSYMEICGFLKKNGLHFADSPFDLCKAWCMGTPTEDGLYVVVIKCDKERGKEYVYHVTHFFNRLGWMYDNVVAWQRITPYEGAST